jgi:hypothetical protein
MWNAAPLDGSILTASLRMFARYSSTYAYALGVDAAAASLLFDSEPPARRFGQAELDISHLRSAKRSQKVAES